MTTMKSTATKKKRANQSADAILDYQRPVVDCSPKRKIEKTNVHLFYKKDNPLSQHYSCNFVIGDIKYNSAEQYMMHQKAVIFRDQAIAKKIMSTADPRLQKKLGRMVENFDVKVWLIHSERVVREGNLAKFSQNENLSKVLLETGSAILAEASAKDCLWGIGLSKGHPNARYPEKWRGKNKLGKALMEVRKQLEASRSGVIPKLATTLSSPIS